MADRVCSTAGCSYPAPDGFVCTVCLTQLDADLRAIAGRSDDRPVGPTTAEAQRVHAADRGLLAELTDTMSRQDRLEPDTHRPPVEPEEPRTKDLPIATTKLPYHPEAGDLLRLLHNACVTWTRHLIEQRYGADLDLLARDSNYRRARPDVPGEPHGPWRQGPQLPDDDTAELARWIARHRETVRQDEWAGVLCAEFGSLVMRAKVIVHPDDVEYLGNCTCERLLCPSRDVPKHDQARCSSGRPHRLDPPAVELYVPRGQIRVECPRCGMTEECGARRLRLFDQVRTQLVTATDGSRALVDYCRAAGLKEPLSPSAIRNMAARGQIAPRPGASGPLYLVGDLMDAVKVRAEREAARGRR